MKAIVGLGNPGIKYNFTRHNIGFNVIDYIADKEKVSFKSKHRALIGSYVLNQEKIMLVKPQTYMNLSGESLREITEYYDLSLKDILVIYDDIDLVFSKMRIRKQGSAGTHNGMKSIIYQLQDDALPRLRMGIGKPENIPLVNYVLQRFSDNELVIVKDMIIQAGNIATSFIIDGIDDTMNKYNK